MNQKNISTAVAGGFTLYGLGGTIYWLLVSIGKISDAKKGLTLLDIASKQVKINISWLDISWVVFSLGVSMFAVKTWTFLISWNKKRRVNWDTLLMDAIVYIERQSSFGEHIREDFHSDTINALWEAAKKGKIPIAGKKQNSQALEKISKRDIKKLSLVGQSIGLRKAMDFYFVTREDDYVEHSVYSALYTDARSLKKVWPPHYK